MTGRSCTAAGVANGGDAHGSADRIRRGCGWLRVQARTGATVVTLGGDIDITNSVTIHDDVCRLFALSGPLIVDTTRLSFLSVSGYRVILDIASHCTRQDKPWILITGAALAPYLRVDPCAKELPVMDDLPEAIHYFQTALGERRRRLRLLASGSRG